MVYWVYFSSSCHLSYQLFLVEITMPKFSKGSFMINEGDRRQVLAELDDLRFFCLIGGLTTQFNTAENLVKLGWKEERLEKEEEWPKIGDEYWCFDPYNIFKHSWSAYTSEFQMKESFGVYRTKKEAEDAFEKAKRAVRGE
jgi:hypothetical protein